MTALSDSLAVIGIATASYFLLERPLMRLRRNLHPLMDRRLPRLTPSPV